jgi:hypothetical protein
VRERRLPSFRWLLRSAKPRRGAGVEPAPQFRVAVGRGDRFPGCVQLPQA